MTGKEQATELFHKLYPNTKITFMHHFTADDMIEFGALLIDPLKDEECPNLKK